MIVVKIKPMSINRAFQGKRFKTPEYKAWRQEFGLVMPKIEITRGLCGIVVNFYHKNMRSDLDNDLKTFLDALVENGVIEDDRKIMEILARKFKSEDERIEFEIVDNSGGLPKQN